METGMLVAVGMASLGGSLMVILFARGRRVVTDLSDFLPAAELGPYERRMGEPFLRRMGRIVGGAVADRLEGSCRASTWPRSSANCAWPGWRASAGRGRRWRPSWGSPWGWGCWPW